MQRAHAAARSAPPPTIKRFAVAPTHALCIPSHLVALPRPGWPPATTNAATPSASPLRRPSKALPGAVGAPPPGHRRPAEGLVQQSNSEARVGQEGMPALPCPSPDTASCPSPSPPARRRLVAAQQRWRRCCCCAMDDVPQQLLDAAAKGDLEALRHALAAGADANAHAGGPLLLAIGHPGCVAELLAAGATPNVATAQGTTALMFATLGGHGGHCACVAPLLAAHADPDAAAGDGGETALILAAAVPQHHSHCGCVAALLAAGANPNAVDKEGQTALHIMALLRSAAGMPPLLAAGANPRVCELNACTPLLLAAASGNTQCCQLLLDAAPDTAAWRNNAGTTALSAALFSGHTDAAQCLLERGALPPPTDVLQALNIARHNAAADPGRVLPLYATFTGRQPLAATEWDRIPTPCAGLGAALPAVLARSTEEAAMLVGHLPPADRERLHAAALALGRLQRDLSAPVPTPLMWRLLLPSVEP